MDIESVRKYFIDVYDSKSEYIKQYELSKKFHLYLIPNFIAIPLLMRMRSTTNFD